MKKKKIFDIIPPQKITFRSNKKVFNFEKEYQIKNKQLKDLYNNAENNPEKIKNKSFFKKISNFFIGLFLIIIIFIVFNYIFFDEATIEIWPKTEMKTFETEVAVKIKNEQLSLSDGEISGKIIKNISSGKKSFPSSGEMIKEKKAEGIIRVYNNYSSADQPLLPNTRFVSESGKLFRSVQREVIPGRRYQQGKIEPGFKDIKVVAAEPGEEYNIGPSTFSIPGFKGSPKYTYFYAKSFSPMTGGFKGNVPQVTDQDIKRAEELLSNEIKQKNVDFLRKAMPETYLLPQNAIFQKITKKESSVKAGEEGESFDLLLEVSSFAIGVNKKDLNSFIESFIISNIEPDKTFEKSSLEVESLIDQSFSSNEEELKEPDTVTLKLRIKAKIYHKIDLKEIKKAVSGKTKKEVEVFLSDISYIDKVSIKYWQVLRKKLPENINKIKILLAID